MIINKRKRVLAFILAVISCFALFGCEDNSPKTPSTDGAKTETNGDTQGDEQPKVDASVNFLDIKEGDCFFIVLPDGKCALIDTADRDNNNSTAKKIESFIKEKNFTKIDYLFLSHTDIDHIGNAEYLINNFEIGKAFVPDIKILDLFPEYQKVKTLLEDKGVNCTPNAYGHIIEGENYFFAFLSPKERNAPDSPYGNLFPNPTTQQINDVSPLIYFECLGVRFLFTGDAGFSQEEVVMEFAKIGAYERFNQGKLKANLENIDFLKVSHHGASDATSQKFLEFIKPKNAVISVGGNNTHGHPKIDVLNRLNSVSSNTLRTDVKGNITVNLYKDLQYKIITEL